MADSERWADAAHSLGLEIADRTRWRSEPSKLSGSVENLQVEIDYTVGRYSRGTWIFVFLPPGRWDNLRFSAISIPYADWPETGGRRRLNYTPTGDLEFDERFVVRVLDGEPAEALAFLTASRRQALLRLEDEVPTVRFTTSPRNWDFYPSRLSYSSTVPKRALWKSGRLPGTQISHHVGAMVSAAHALASQG